MKKHLKYLLLLFILILLSGCGATETIDVSKTGNVSEEVKVFEDNTTLIMATELSNTEYIEQLLEPYESILNSNEYAYGTYIEEYNSGVYAKKDYEEVCSFFKTSLVINKLYRNVDCTESKKYYEVVANNLLANGSEEDSYVLDNVDSLELTIKTDYKALDDNADKYKKGTYVWNLSKKDLEKDLHIKISKYKIEEVKQDDNEEFIDSSDKKKSNKTLVFVFGGIAIVLFVTIIILRKLHNRTKLDY